MINVKLKRIDKISAVKLAHILSTDKTLHQILNPHIEQKGISLENFLTTTKKWENLNNAISFAIIENNVAIGMISISHIDKTSNTANIGYWICSNKWGKGIMTKAFRKCLLRAKKMNIKSVSATIEKDNIASIKIWQNYNAVLEESKEKVIVKLTI